jgi:hypothetical protein
VVETQWADPSGHLRLVRTLRTVTPEEFLALSAPEQEAVIVAVLARNGVEDLPADGVFDDGQAPALNRRFRQEAYQATYAARQVAEGDDRFTAYLAEVAGEGHPDADDDMRLLCLSGAIARAVRSFADEFAISDEIAQVLVEAAQVAVLDEAGEANAFMTSPIGLQLFFSLTSTWEPPRLSDRYRARHELV